MGTEMQARDHRRSQLIGDTWLEKWLARNRDCAKGAGAWIESRILRTEEPRYVWIWIPPYRDLHPELDPYRAQSAGRALLNLFANQVHSASGYWIESAAAHAKASSEEWLFILQVMHADGWTRIDEQERRVWTKAQT